MQTEKDEITAELLQLLRPEGGFSRAELRELHAKDCWGHVKEHGHTEQEVIEQDWQKVVAEFLIKKLDHKDYTHVQRIGFFTNALTMTMKECPQDLTPDIRRSDNGDRINLVFPHNFQLTTSMNGNTGRDFRCLMIKVDPQGPIYTNWDPTHVFVAKKSADDAIVCGSCGRSLNEFELGKALVGCDSATCMGLPITCGKRYKCDACKFDVCPRCHDLS